MTAASANLIDRREYKYLIDASTADAVRAAIRPFCEVDPWAARSRRGVYTIESIYLDDRALSLFWANAHEQVDRFKVRVRGYAGAPGSPVFFEVKRRVNDVISKSRGKVPRALYEAMLTDPGGPIPAEIGGKDREAVERFLAIHGRMHLRPLTMVRYEREPYFSRIDDYARVTFDTAIRAQAVSEYSFDLRPRGWRALDDAVTQGTLTSLVVLELKFTAAVPLWMVNMVGRLGLTRRSFSKYGTSVRAHYQAMETRTAHGVGGWR